mmetsp:Transcript_44854/g.129621  ORF Transcript_44854/g.129621 Transcript_44854/m.129621 type:complete len:327 (+) Transcript_44854:1311-2291(+)
MSTGTVSVMLSEEPPVEPFGGEAFGGAGPRMLGLKGVMPEALTAAFEVAGMRPFGCGGVWEERPGLQRPTFGKARLLTLVAGASAGGGPLGRFGAPDHLALGGVKLGDMIGAGTVSISSKLSGNPSAKGESGTSSTATVEASPDGLFGNTEPSSAFCLFAAGSSAESSKSTLKDSATASPKSWPTAGSAAGSGNSSTSIVATIAAACAGGSAGASSATSPTVSSTKSSSSAGASGDSSEASGAATSCMAASSGSAATTSPTTSMQKSSSPPAASSTTTSGAETSAASASSMGACCSPSVSSTNKPSSSATATSSAPSATMPGAPAS